MSGEVEWGDPPPRKPGGRPSPWKSAIEQLRERPGEWARLRPEKTHHRATVARLRPQFPDVEFTTRQTGSANDEVDIFARWVGN